MTDLEKALDMADRYIKEVALLTNKISDLEDENARLLQQRDAANAQIDFLIEEMKKAP